MALADLIFRDTCMYDTRPAEENISAVQQLKREKNALILCHTYQRPEIHRVADLVGDSYGLSREATKADKPLIVFCGVHFMAETAKILNPEKKVLLPSLDAGCGLAETITAEGVRAWKAKHPGAPLVL
ncbi:quinolinate synthase NadA [Candidatus Woesearchaeota archaeon]|nr:quinolinate synthase NadA [Candidatus Woesearchaeota archaeon]